MVPVILANCTCEELLYTPSASRIALTCVELLIVPSGNKTLTCAELDTTPSLPSKFLFTPLANPVKSINAPRFGEFASNIRSLF